MGNYPQFFNILEYLGGLALIQLFIVKMLHVIDNGKFFVGVRPQFASF